MQTMAHLEEMLFTCPFRGVWSSGRHSRVQRSHSFSGCSLHLELCGKLLGGIPKGMDIYIYIYEEFHSRNIKLPSDTNMLLTFSVSIKVSSKDENDVSLLDS